MKGNQTSDTEPLHLICRLQWNRLRNWKKRSLRAEVAVGGRIRPQAYSSSSSAFRGFLDDWNAHSTKPAVLWIVTSYRLPGRRHKVPSLAAKIYIKNVLRGNDDQLTEELRRYVVRWRNSKKENRPHLCRIVEAETEFSRFFPANDISICLNHLQYVNKDGKQTTFSPRRVLRVKPEDKSILEKYAESVAKNTIFISYKHIDFKDKSSRSSPPWTINALAEAFITAKFGVWLDTLCAKPSEGGSSKDLSTEEVRLLLKEGHAQSAIVIGIDTENYLTPGEGGQNLTLDEYEGKVGGQNRVNPLSRFVLYGDKKRKFKPSPDDGMNWSRDLQTEIVPRVMSLINSGDTNRL